MLIYSFVLGLETEVRRGQRQMSPAQPTAARAHRHPGDTGPARSTLCPQVPSRLMARLPRDWMKISHWRSCGWHLARVPPGTSGRRRLPRHMWEGTISAQEPFLAGEAHLAHAEGREVFRGPRPPGASFHPGPESQTPTRAREGEGCGSRRACSWLSSGPGRGSQQHPAPLQKVSSY